MDTSSTGNVYGFKCPNCGYDKLDKIETCMCKIKSSINAVAVKNYEGTLDMQETLIHSGMPHLLPGDGDEAIICASCGKQLGIDFSEEEAFTVYIGKQNLLLMS